MLDLKLLREDPDRARSALGRRGVPGEEVDEVLRLDARRRELLPEVEGMRAEQKRASQAIADAKRSGSDASTAIEQMQGMSRRVKELQAEAGTVKDELDARLTGLPNLPADSAPVDDEVVREVGEAGRTGADHLEELVERVRRAAALQRGPRPVRLVAKQLQVEHGGPAAATSCRSSR